jgi:hypothetical protein
LYSGLNPDLATVFKEIARGYWLAKADFGVTAQANEGRRSAAFIEQLLLGNLG